MKKVSIALVIVCILGLVAMSHAWWSGQVRKNGNPLTPAGYAEVTAVGGSDPNTTASAQGYFVLDETHGMTHNTYYSHLWGEYWEDEDEWGGWCYGGTYDEEVNRTNMNIPVTHPPTEWKDDK